MKAESSKVTKRRLSPETLELIRQRGLARAAGNRELTSELAKQCRQAIKDDLEERKAAVMVEEAEAGKSIRKARRIFANYKNNMIALRRPDGTTTASRKAMEKIIHEYYSDLFDSHVHLPSYEIKEDAYVVPPTALSLFKSAYFMEKNLVSCTLRVDCLGRELHVDYQQTCAIFTTQLLVIFREVASFLNEMSGNEELIICVQNDKNSDDSILFGHILYFLAIITFARQHLCDVSLFFGRPGRPLIVAVEDDSGYSSEFIISTVEGDDISDDGSLASAQRHICVSLKE
uniref:Uncharacterized protein n=1 Tax=Angiostrongylus cantonensis TaxID=6313 RepID=A0A158P636_ANGCA